MKARGAQTPQDRQPNVKDIVRRYRRDDLAMAISECQKAATDGVFGVKYPHPTGWQPREVL